MTLFEPRVTLFECRVTLRVTRGVQTRSIDEVIP